MTRTRSTAPRGQRGASLLEALIAFVVLACSTLAVAQLQSQLRQGGDVARQRSEAVRLGEEEIENLRAFAALPAASGVRSYAAIVDAETTIAAGNASYRVVRTVDELAVAGAKSVSVRVQWADRSGAPREVSLASFIARSDPAHAGALGLGAGAVPAAPRGAGGRAPAVPVDARDLGNGRSAWKPTADAPVAFVFDNAGGDIVTRCTVASTVATRDLTAADLGGCVAGRSLLLGGTIRFTAALPPLPSEATEAPPEVGIALALTGGTYSGAPACFSEARKTVRYLAGGSMRIEAVAIAATPASLGVASWTESGDRFVAWHCVVAPRGDGRWSGRADLVAGAGWTIGGGSGDRRVCRFSHDADGSGAIDAGFEHPADYTDVSGALPAQNFLVVRGDAACPAAPAVRLTGEGAVVHADLGTLAHQP